MEHKNVETYDERLTNMVKAINKRIKTEKLIDMLVSASCEQGYAWSDKECIIAFTETNCMPFNVNDLAFRKAEKASGIDDLLETIREFVAEKRIDEAIKLSEIRKKLRDELLSRFDNLLYFKKGGK